VITIQLSHITSLIARTFIRAQSASQYHRQRASWPYIFL